MQSLSSVNHFFPFISTNWLVSANFEDMRFLGPHSAGEGPYLVPISLKIGSPSGPHFEKKVGPHGMWPQWITLDKPLISYQ